MKAGHAGRHCVEIARNQFEPKLIVTCSTSSIELSVFACATLHAGDIVVSQVRINERLRD